jgi:ADP-ribose diphosphatase
MRKKEPHETLWHGKVFDLNREEILLPTGRKTTVEVIRHPGSASIVPLLNDGQVILIQQFRPSLRQVIWEIPAGTMGPGEDPLGCARRELMEECGYQANRFEKLGEVLPAPGYCDERVHLFVATDLTPCAQHLDEDECLTIHPLPFERALDMIRRGEIRDAMTIIGLHMAHPVWKKDGSGDRR